MSTSKSGSQESLTLPSTEIGERITSERRKAVDRLYFTPRERADFVNTLRIILHKEIKLKNEEDGREPTSGIPTDWDYLAFAVEYIAQQSIAIGDEEFMEAAKQIVRIFYSWHYGDPTEIYGEPDRGRSD